MQLKKLVPKLTLAVCLALPLVEAQAQNLPGNVIQELSVNAEIVTLFGLAAQVYPALFTGASSWYSWSGYTYKFYSGSGIYAGVKDGVVYLTGGPFGGQLVSKGGVTAAVAALQKIVSQPNNGGGTSVDFGTIASVKTTADLPRLFDELTLEWYTSGLTTQIKMERVGVEQVSGISTEHVKMTLSGFNAGSGIVGDLWIDSSGVTRRYISGGFEYPAAQADVLSKNITAAMMIALAGAETPSVKTAIEAAAKSPDVATKVKKTILGAGSYDTLTISIGNTQSLHYIADLTDLGSFSMVTRFEGKLGATMANGYSIVNMRLR